MEDSTGATWTISPSLSTARGGTGAALTVPASTGTGNLTDLVGGQIFPDVPDDVAAALAPLSGSRPGARAVIGTDDRTRITNVTASPYVQMPLFIFDRPGNGTSACTGWLYGNRTLATAAHCLTDGQGTWYTNFRVYFGLDGNTAYAQCGYNVLAAPTGWDGTTGSAYDWGVVVLNCNAGNVLGSMGYQALDSAPSGSWSVTGYPADKSPANTMWTHAAPVAVQNSDKWKYEIDTYHGQSGAPIWRLEAGTACGNCAIGIHTTGGTTSNSGVRITNAVGSTLHAYSARYP
ncbi:serine protease [Cellulomonas sp. PS-H5]|uniref:trypsin-like serine peptidase n=1 Tax=Cellulomonas sp. PS-H5 TaxID=2820400 RepID=UPI001C4E5E6A|nr:trypsin-like peptidase domain-containing protein [Cellulomonas sp. PS-H5]MBW0256283.1 trypsin-like serine protease [Cellulomonas sp. PS-H5]